MEKFLFLDIDGVLNCRADKTMYGSGDDSLYGISPRCLVNLKRLINLTNCKVILSTSWRNHSDDFVWTNGIHSYRSPLPKLRKILGDCIYDECPHAHGNNKADDIDMWFQYKYPEGDCKFVILDDQTNQGLQEYGEHFIRTDPYYGLEFYKMMEAASMLSDGNEKVIFLDIDGVLNNYRDGSGKYDADSEDDTYKIPISMTNLNNLKCIIDEVPEVKIVWCTSWRSLNKDTLGHYKNPVKYLESLDWIKSRVIGVTPMKMSSTKVEEVGFYLGEHVTNISRFVILDDDVTRHFDNHLFGVDIDHGLTRDQAKRVIEYLKS